MAAKLLQLTENSWILRTTDTTSGLLFYQDGEYTLMTEKTRTKFADELELQKKFGKLKIEEREQESIQTTFLGYPVKHQKITQTNENPPTYVKQNGKIEFVAGYWGILFANGWAPSWCPKLETVVKNKVVGPFKNKMEMTNHIKNLNNKAVENV